MPKSLRQPNPRQHVGGGAAGIAPIGQFQRQHYVFQCRQVAQQLKALKYKTDFLRPQCRPGVFIDGKQVLSGQVDRASAGGIESGDDRQQGAFARTRGTDNGHCLALVQAKINITQNIERAGGVGDRFEHVLNRDNAI